MISHADHSTALILEGKLERIIHWYDSVLGNGLEKESETIVLIFTSRCRKFNYFKNFLWRKIKHSKDAGGATMTTFQIAYQSKQDWKEIKALPNWSLSELVNTTVSGKSIEAPLNKNIMLKLVNWNKPLSLPSIFSHTGWVKRKLILPEVL